MKKILALLTLCSTLALADIPKIFSVMVKDTSSTAIDLTVTVNAPVEGFLLISYRSAKDYNEYYLDEERLGGGGEDPTFFASIEAGEHEVKLIGTGGEQHFKQIQILYIPQRQETSSLNETPTNNNNTVFPLGYLISPVNGAIYDKTGRQTMSVSKGEKISIQSLSKGTYYIKGKTSQSTKIIIP